MPIKCALGLTCVLAVQTALAWPDLAVTKSGPVEAAPGEVISYTLAYTNKGPVKSTVVVLKDYLPSDVTVLTNTLDGASISGSTIYWSLGTIASRKGGSRTFQVRLNTNAPAGGFITNRAEIWGKEAEESGKKANNTSKFITRIINRPPVALDDAYSVNVNSTLAVSAPGVLLNDNDPDGHGLNAILVSGPIHGALTLDANGSFAYTPISNYTGGDAFTYRASDGFTNSNVATVQITITPVNSMPVAMDDSYITPEDTPITISEPGVLGNDHDGDGDVLQAILVSDPLHGTLVLNMNGSFTYTPVTNYTGPDSFTYMANDGQADSAVATVSILVTPLNGAPVALDDDYTVDEDSTLNVPMPGILTNDVDPDGDSIVALLESGPAQGSLMVNPDGSFSYTPTNDYAGADSFTYRTSDGQTNSNVAVVTITVLPVNDPPLAVNDAYTTPEDTALQISAPGVLANDTDADGDMLNAIFVTGPTNGTVTLSTNGSFVYVPTSDFIGQDSFTYRAADGTTNSDVAIVVLTITPMNDPPVAVDDGYATPEDTPLTVAAPGIVANDSDPDGDALSALLVGNPSHGILTLNGDGSFTYTPTNDFHGLDQFTYRASDALLHSEIATVTIRVTPVNDPPDTNNWSGHSFTLYEDTLLEVGAPGLLAGIFDPDLDQLRALFENHPLHGTLTLNTNGSFIHRPLTNYFGSDSFRFRVGDGQILSPVLTVNLTVLPVNDAPSFTKGPSQFHQQNAGPQIFPAWASHISAGPENEAGQAVGFEVSNDNSALFTVQPALSTTGTLTYTLAPEAWGVATVTVVARDDGGTANGGVDSSVPQTFSITVNAPPTVSIVSPTNGSSFFVPGSFTLLAEAQDLDGTIEKVELFAGTTKIAESTSPGPHFTILTNLPVGTYTYGATAKDNHGATGTAAPVTVNVIERPPVTFLTSVYYNPQTDFFEQRLRIHNPTYSLLDAVRIKVYNLTNTPPITVHNLSGYANGVPYVQTHAAVPPGSHVDMTVEFHSPMRIKPNPVLQAELVPPATGFLSIINGSPQPINRVLMLANQTFLIEFATLSNRVYSVEYSTNLVDWKAVQPAISGNGNWVQWIDNGQPKTDSPPALQPARFYRLKLWP